MSKDRIASSTHPSTDGTATDEEQHANRCSQVLALCCCIPRRRMSLPGKRPKERNKKKNAGGLSFSDIMFEEEMGLTSWDIPLGGQDGEQIRVIKPTHLQCPRACGTKDHCIALPIRTFSLQEKVKGKDEKPDIKSFYREGKVLEQPKEGLHDLRVSGSEMANKTEVSPISEGPPLEASCQVTPDKENRQTARPLPRTIGTFYLEERLKGKDEKPDVKSFHREDKVLEQPKEGLHDLSVLGSETVNITEVSPVSEVPPLEASCQVTPVKENRQTGRPGLLGALVQGRHPVTMVSMGASCTKAQKKLSQQATPFPELQQTGKQAHQSTFPDCGRETREEQNHCADHGGSTVLQDLLNQPQIPCHEAEQLLGQPQLAKHVVHKAEEQAAWDKENVVPKEYIQKNVQGDPDPPYQEKRQPVELTCPPSLPIMEVNHEQEQSEMQHHMQTSHNETQHNYQQIVDQDIQHPTIPKPMSCSFQDAACEKEREGQGTVNATPDGPLSKAESQQCIPHQLVQDVAQENKTTRPLDVTCAMGQQKLAHVNNTCEEALAYMTEQKNLEEEHALLPDHVGSADHGRMAHEKEQQGGTDHSHSDFQDTARAGEQEYPGLVMSENMDTPPDDVSYEKEQQRKLDCGDSGSDSLPDKEDQGHEAALCLEGQPPLVLGQFGSVLLNGTSEVEQCTRKSGTQETHSLEEKQVKCGDQSRKLMSVSSEEKEEKDDQEEQDAIPIPLTRWKAQEETMVACHTEEVTVGPHSEQQQKEPFSLAMTWEEHQRKEKQGLSETMFSRKDEENM